MSPVDKLIYAPFKPWNQVEDLDEEIKFREWVLEQRLLRTPEVIKQIANGKIQKIIGN